MAKSYDISDKIKTAFATRLIAQFDHNAVDDLSANPIITKTITNKTPEPYVYVQDVGSTEAWVSKTSEARDYQIMVQVVVKNRTNRGTHKMREQISNEVINILVTNVEDYPDISSSGFVIHEITSGEVVKYDTVERGARYYIANIPINVIAALDEEAAGDEDPVQAIVRTYSDFQHNPVSNNIEWYDSGNITYATSYSSDNNGWDFNTVTYVKSSGNDDGTLTDNVLAVGSGDENLGVQGTINYLLDSDNSRTFNLVKIDNYNRIASFRYGSIASANKPVFTDDNADDTGLRNISDWTDTNRTVQYGTENPNNESITLVGNRGEYFYLVTDATVSNITAVNHAVAGQSENLLSKFDTPQTIGKYKVYVWSNALNFDTNIDVTIVV